MGSWGRSRGKARIQESTLASGDVQRMGTSEFRSIILKTLIRQVSAGKSECLRPARSVLELMGCLSRCDQDAVKACQNAFGSHWAVTKATLCMGARLQSGTCGK